MMDMLAKLKEQFYVSYENFSGSLEASATTHRDKPEPNADTRRDRETSTAVEPELKVHGGESRKRQKTSASTVTLSSPQGVVASLRRSASLSVSSSVKASRKEHHDETK
jgi:uncharacterized protein (DUF2345 family)